MRLLYYLHVQECTDSRDVHNTSHQTLKKNVTPPKQLAAFNMAKQAFRSDSDYQNHGKMAFCSKPPIVICHPGLPSMYVFSNELSYRPARRPIPPPTTRCRVTAVIRMHKKKRLASRKDVTGGIVICHPGFPSMYVFSNELSYPPARRPIPTPTTRCRVIAVIRMHKKKRLASRKDVTGGADTA